jgi:purine-binding chemotaxis protein CheW
MMREATAPQFGQDQSARPADGAREAAGPSWLLCRAGRIRCALPIEYVIEIMRVLPLEQLAGAPPYVRGVSVIRGAPVPVVDVGLIISDRITQPTRLVTIRAASRTIALAIETVLGLSAIAADALGQLPPLLEDIATDTIAAIGARDCELLVFLRTGRLVPDDVFDRLDAAGAKS